MGGFLSYAQQSFPPSPTWGPNDIPTSLARSSSLPVRGGAGIGKESVKSLLEHNAKVYLATRSATKANAAIAELKDKTGKEAIFLHLDLADLPAVRKSAREFLSKETQLHILINNAGVMVPPVEETTVQKYDLQFGTNVIGHWLFTILLLPALFAATDASTTHEKARVVTVSSSANYLTNGLDFEAFTDGPRRRKYGKWELYHKSKLIVSTSLNPGNINTDLQRHMPQWLVSIIRVMLYSVTFGALTQLYCATAPAAADANGKFFIPWAREGKANKAAEDPQVGEKLWAWLEEQTKKY
ncbi:NAD(P)-binding protein [Russula earlei]|uniref:NAD(P)-binding protein n=1 Tax=Russula earlei TaxID=71964 RepID=A0ACC0TRA1_9AGAM|nr:NAD(P)-binding protein [Russula earlei]